MRIHVVVSIRVWSVRGDTKAGSLTDLFLVPVPHECWAHEGFVVKPRRQNPSEPAVYCTEVEFDAGPDIDTARIHPLDNFHLRGAKIWDR